jgi:chorismate mutase
MMPSGVARLEEIRRQIDELDAAIIALLATRMHLAHEVKVEKLRLNRPIIDEQRQKEVVAKWCEHAQMAGGARADMLSAELLEKMAKLVIEYTVKSELEEQG